MVLVRKLASRRFAPAGLAAVALASGLLGTVPAFAQAQRPAQRPAQQPAQQPQSQPQQQQQQQPQGPTIVQVKPEPSQTDWVKVCGKDPGNQKEICYTTRDFVSDQGQPVLAVAVYEVKGEPTRIVRFLMPLGLLIQPGIRFAADNAQPQAGRYAICLPNGCFAENQVNDAFVASMKKGNVLNVSVQNQVAREVTFQVPLTGFGKGYDGPAIDPKVLEEQQQKLAQELQKRAEEQRKALESQAQQQQQNAPAPAPAAPAAPAAPKP